MFFCYFFLFVRRICMRVLVVAAISVFLFEREYGYDPLTIPNLLYDFILGSQSS